MADGTDTLRAVPRSYAEFGTVAKIQSDEVGAVGESCNGLGGIARSTVGQDIDRIEILLTSIARSRNAMMISGRSSGSWI